MPPSNSGQLQCTVAGTYSVKSTYETNDFSALLYGDIRGGVQKVLQLGMIM